MYLESLSGKIKLTEKQAVEILRARASRTNDQNS